MKKILLILLLFPSLIFGQTNKYQKIANIAKKLTGTWLLTTSETDESKAEQKIINGEYWELITKSGTTTDTIKKDGFYVIELSFEGIGRGDYQEYSNYQVIDKDNDFIEIESCQPVPWLIFKNDKIVIHMTYMLGEDIEEILELTDNKLILLNSDKLIRTFERIK